MDASTRQTENAVSLFKGGLNCCQAIVAGFGESLGLNPALGAKLATGLGGGMGRMGLTCGAVTGAYLVLGIRHGAATGQDREAKEKTYELVREFTARFKARNASIVCQDLLGCDISTPEGFEESRHKGLHTTVCAKLVRDAGEILAELL
jgi:C_GCAxxG_C_C family probable redox protein